MPGIRKSVSLQSAHAEHFAGSTRVELHWNLESGDGPEGAYRATELTVTVYPNPGVVLEAVEIHLLERDPRTGLPFSDIRRHLAWDGEGYRTTFDWNSLARIPEQELHVVLKGGAADLPEVRLQDPISRRFNFLLSLAA